MTAADPQPPPVGGLAWVTLMTQPCQTEVPGGRCGASGFAHYPGQRDGKRARTRCSVATRAGSCPCTLYTPEIPIDYSGHH
jgi:hypothetical protein